MNYHGGLLYILSSTLHAILGSRPYYGCVSHGRRDSKSHLAWLSSQEVAIGATIPPHILSSPHRRFGPTNPCAPHDRGEQCSGGFNLDHRVGLDQGRKPPAARVRIPYARSRASLGSMSGSSARTDGSSATMPLPLAYRRIFAVPRSIARSGPARILRKPEISRFKPCPRSKAVAIREVFAERTADR